MDDVTKAINHFSVLMEDQNSKLDAVLEQLGDLPKIQDFRRLEVKVDTIDRRLVTVEAAVKATNHDIADLDQRVTRLAACRRERNSSHASRSANARVVQSTGKSARRERGRRQNRDRDGGPMTWKDATTLALRPE
jgi:hypothetical protein